MESTHANHIAAAERNTIDASVTIQRSVEDVFRFYRDFENLPTFLGDVMAIEQIGPATLDGQYKVP